MRVSSNGGIAEPITTLTEGQGFHSAPTFYPNGEAVLFSLVSTSVDDAQLAVVLLSTGDRRLLGRNNPVPLRGSWLALFPR